MTINYGPLPTRKKRATTPGQKSPFRMDCESMEPGGWVYAPENAKRKTVSSNMRKWAQGKGYKLRMFEADDGRIVIFRDELDGVPRKPAASDALRPQPRKAMDEARKTVAVTASDGSVLHLQPVEGSGDFNQRSTGIVSGPSIVPDAACYCGKKMKLRPNGRLPAHIDPAGDACAGGGQEPGFDPTVTRRAARPSKALSGSPT